MKKILVTGASGFIGNHVVNKLLETDCKIITSATSLSKVEQYEWFSKVDFISYDIINQKILNLYEYFSCPDLVIHLAWPGLPNYKSELHVDLYLPRQIDFLSDLLKQGLKSVSIVGTCFEYGMQEGELMESFDCNPVTAYGIAKNALRMYIEELRKEYDFNYKWVRLFYTYGLGQNNKSILPQLKFAIDQGQEYFNMSGGEQVRDFLEVSKLASNLTKISLDKNFNGVVNNCSGKGIKIKDFVQNYINSCGSNIKLNLGHYPYLDYEPMQFWGNINLLERILNNSSTTK
ncbi:MAG TPA: NAD-dependent epimerase/dehydratase family protein [Saprospiraceae bacterium]|nr:NAD-dependent epimerase/dehydratase family protein [Saprospiraceae bacterium]